MTIRDMNRKKKLQYFNDNNYIIYSDGNIWSKRRKRFITGEISNVGYRRVILDGHRISVHQIMALCFLDWRDDLVVNHLDEDKLNNNINNLEMCTQKYNIRYSTSKKVLRSDGKIYECLSDVVLDGYSKGNIGKCCNGKRKTAYGYHWQYVN